MNEAPAPDLHPRSTPGALIAASVLLLPVLLFTLGWLVQMLNPGFGVCFTEVFIFFGLSWMIVRMSGRDPLRYTGLSPARPGAALYGFTLGVVNFFGVAIPILFLSQQLFPRSWVETFDSARVFRDRTPLEMALIVSGVILAAPLGEEYFFRGVLQRALGETRVRTRWAIAVTALVFSAVHGDPVGFAARLELGLLFGWVYWRTGSLWPNMLAHAANNATTTVLYFLQGGENASGPTTLSAEAVLPVLLFGALGVTALAALLRAPARWPELLARRESEERQLPQTGFYR
ncbi:MAG TPA: CPBP family intramembrane glutamic endopeptidase, partial [Myxococcaceae bacterium]|nr:CPBP family intramembrane glutamic endopeptidase [Myxococcaceae bacterium]